MTFHKKVRELAESEHINMWERRLVAKVLFQIDGTEGLTVKQLIGEEYVSHKQASKIEEIWQKHIQKGSSKED
jgi:hypothetical protein